MFNFFKKRNKQDPHKYKMLCKNCDIFFESEDPRFETCPACKQWKRVEVYSLIDKETGQELR